MPEQDRTPTYMVCLCVSVRVCMRACVRVHICTSVAVLRINNTEQELLFQSVVTLTIYVHTYIRRDNMLTSLLTV